MVNRHRDYAKRAPRAECRVRTLKPIIRAGNGRRPRSFTRPARQRTRRNTVLPLELTLWIDGSACLASVDNRQKKTAQAGRFS